MLFWCWTLWWGLNDRGPRSMYPKQRARRCFVCRTAPPLPRRPARAAGRASPNGSLMLDGLGARDERNAHTARQPSFASSCFSERELAVGEGADSKV